MKSKSFKERQKECFFLKFLSLFMYFYLFCCFSPVRRIVEWPSSHMHTVKKFECIPFEKWDPSRTQMCCEVYKLGPVWAYGLTFVQLGCCTARPAQDIYLLFDIWGFQSNYKKKSWQKETAGSKTAAIFIFLCSEASQHSKKFISCFSLQVFCLPCDWIAVESALSLNIVPLK